MTLSDIARRHFAAALAEAGGSGHDGDALARAMLAEVLAAYLRARTIESVREELLAAADNLDPDTDYPFMRP